MQYSSSASNPSRALPSFHFMSHGQVSQSLYFNLVFALAKFLVAIALGLAAMNNLPHLIHFGPTTLNAAIPVAVVLASFPVALLFSRVPRAALTPLLLYLGFLLYVCVYVLLIPYKLQTFQNVTLYLAVGGLAIVTFQCGGFRPSFSRFLTKSIKASVWGATVLWAVFLLTGYGAFAPRAYALLLVAGIALYIAESRNGQPYALVKALLLFFLCLSTVSRMASAMACIVLLVTYLDAAKPYFWFKVMISIVFALIIFAGISFLVPSFHESSFGGGEALQIGEFAINTKGRLFWWDVLWHSFLQAPFFGQGPGSFTDAFFMAVQPHNDHLRLLHDFGIVGYALWWLAIGGALAVIMKGWRCSLACSRADTPILMATFLYCGAFIVTMITDNVVIYTPNAFPFAVMLGGALGISGRLIASNRHERTSPHATAPMLRSLERP